MLKTAKKAVRSVGGDRLFMRLVQASVNHGLDPAWVGYRHIRHQSVAEYFAKLRGHSGIARYETVEPPAVAINPLPCNVGSADDLPADRGWWGYSFRDVPQRPSGETFLATLKDCRIACYRDAQKGNDFYPAIVGGDGVALNERELRFRRQHSTVLRHGGPPMRLEKATWFLERVYHNHSHWLTAHLPKLLLLRERGELDGRVLFPRERTPAMDGSLRMLGIDPEELTTFDAGRPLEVEELTLVWSDRFRPEMLRRVPRAIGVLDAPPGKRRVLISRAGASRRRMANEDSVWGMLGPEGFERVTMESMRFEEQVALMRETAILIAPHGAGLTNMMFCPPGTHVVEIADWGFPNPNFYALASAMRHRYWWVAATSVGEGHPLDLDLKADVERLRDVLPRLLSSAECGQTRGNAS